MAGSRCGGKNLKFIYANTNKMPVANPTAGYCQAIGRLQCRHSPFNKIKLISGILSYQAIGCLQCGQYERPKIVFWRRSR